ncbi:MAG: DUF4416 family protein [Planctomycetes bacterium]|nr:DUF4416 family protein [Planctomycetota bacterium]
MRRTRPILPVNLIVGMLAGDVGECLFDAAENKLEKEFGPINLASEVFPFNTTDHYEKEMGSDIKRKFVSFERLIEPDGLAAIKVATNRMEEAFSVAYPSVSRPINLDPGYIGGGKLVLATTKDYAHRIYLGEGIYAEVTLRYMGGRFVPLPWTYTDYKTIECHAFLSRVRGRYLEKIYKQAVDA